jgi:hypothetical protein
MAEEKPKRDRKSEYSRRKARQLAAESGSEESPNEAENETLIKIQLSLLEQRTKSDPTDADRDIDFAYRNMGSPSITPLMAPGLPAWQWYLYARTWPEKFLEICAKREDAKAKQAGTITNQRMEDDKRKQFAILDRIQSQLKLDVKEVVDDLMTKFPEDVLHTCRKHKAAWAAYFEKYPFHEPDKR